MRVLGLLFVWDIFILLNYCFDLKEHGEYGSDCHWELKEYKLDCPLKLDNYSSCIGNDIDLDTVNHIYCLCLYYFVKYFDSPGQRGFYVVKLELYLLVGILYLRIKQVRLRIIMLYWEQMVIFVQIQ